MPVVYTCEQRMTQSPRVTYSIQKDSMTYPSQYIRQEYEKQNGNSELHGWSAPSFLIPPLRSILGFSELTSSLPFDEHYPLAIKNLIIIGYNPCRPY
jgi:hypothetical protein